MELSHLNTNSSYYVISAGALGRGKARIVIEVDHYKRIRKMATGYRWMKKKGFPGGRCKTARHIQEYFSLVLQGRTHAAGGKASG